MKVQDIKTASTADLEKYHDTHIDQGIKDQDLIVLMEIENELQRRGIAGYAFN